MKLPQLNNSGLIESLGMSVANQFPNGVSADQRDAFNSQLQILLDRNLAENGYPSDLMQRLENSEPGNNSDIWDAHVGYMANHPDEAPPDIDQLDAAIREMAQNPEIEAAYLDSLVSNMAQQPGTSPGNDGGFSGLSDLMGTGILQNMSGVMQEVLDRTNNNLQSEGEMSSDELGNMVQNAALEFNGVQIQTLLQQQNLILGDLGGILNQNHGSMMDAIQNLRADSGQIIEGEAVSLENEASVVEAEPETGVFDAYSDEGSDSYNDESDSNVLD